MFKNWSTKRVQMAVVAGLLLGVTTPIAAMMMRSHHSEAAVAVIDEKNIAEAIKTAISTANILTTEEKELALMILDAKKINMDMLAGWMEKNKAADTFCKTPDIMQDIGILKQQGKVPSILNANTSATAILMNEIGSIEDAMNGKQTIVDLYMQTQKNHKALDATYRAAAERAKASQKVTEATNATVHDAVTMANNAEGQQQIMQAGIQIAAAGVLQGADQKELLAQLLAMQSEKWYVENTEKARDEARDHAMALKLHNFAGSH